MVLVAGWCFAIGTRLPLVEEEEQARRVELLLALLPLLPLVVVLARRGMATIRLRLPRCCSVGSSARRPHCGGLSGLRRRG